MGRREILNTLYELLKVKENASQEELTESYHKILEKAASLPQSEKLIEQVRRIKIAYGILSDVEKRKKYDLDLATKRADELLENVQVKKEEVKPEVMESFIAHEQEEKLKQTISEQIDHVIENYNVSQVKQQNDQKLVEKRQKQQLRKAKKEAKKQQQLKREMEIQAYGRYLENQGYKVKYPWTWPRVKRLLISIVTVCISGFILWHIPFVKNTLVNLYQENFVVKLFVDMIASIFGWLINGIKSIFK